MVIYLVNNYAIKGNNHNKFDLYKKHYDFNIAGFVWCYCDTIDGFYEAETIANEDIVNYPLMFKGIEDLEVI